METRWTERGLQWIDSSTISLDIPNRGDTELLGSISRVTEQDYNVIISRLEFGGDFKGDFACFEFEAFG